MVSEEDVLVGCVTGTDDEAIWVCWAVVEGEVMVEEVAVVVATEVDDGAAEDELAGAPYDVDAEAEVAGVDEELETTAADEVATGAEEGATGEELLVTAFEELPLPLSISKL